ncbi:hypothetical protein AN216_08180 [Streptomyces oceani]|uniref:DUF1365 domain-containing protein n=1 Tax=Streptomyces oceani TaxID=1075402 RepID=A0A1E7KKA3_9ACTN|nr:hypothetical protein AN216_08180 [Streptomyces oceani]
MAPTPALYHCTLTHRRAGPVRYAFRSRTYLWLVDPARPPRLPRPLRWLARFDARDHFDGTAPDIRAGLDRFLTARGEPPPDGPVLMLAHARVAGHVFNPLTVFWCHHADGTPHCVVAEVHNTYGQRHCYLLHPDDTDAARAAKEFYVSPFFPVDGHYVMRLPAPGARLALTVRLERQGRPALTATVRGSRRPATVRGLCRAVARHGWSTVAVSAGIRWHGVRLYLRGLPVQPRPWRGTRKAPRQAQEVPQ